jgi:single-strand DNA-binding protein
MSLNKVLLIGNLGKDPETRQSNSGITICNVTIATKDRRRDQAGNWSDHTEWHNVVCFGKVADNVSRFMRKGKQVYVEGKLQTRKWQDKEGRDRYTTEIVADSILFLGTKQEIGGESDMGHDVPMAQAANAPAVFASLKSADSIATGNAIGGSSAGDISFDDDDIPF